MSTRELSHEAYHPNRNGSDGDRWLCSLVDITEHFYKRFLFVWGASRKTPALRFGLIKSGKLNAWASTQGGEDTIGINLGLIFLMRDLFDRMFSHPDIFTPNESETNRDFYPALAVDIDLEQAMLESRPYVPNDATRKNRAEFCLQVVLLWIFAHELSHIYLGHCDFLKSAGELPRISEDGMAGSKLSGRDRQAMEDMADSLATMYFAEIVLTTDQHLSKPERMGRLFTSLFAINCVLIKFRGLNLGRPDSVNATHPMPLFRYLGFVTLAGTVITSWTGDFTPEEVSVTSLEASRFARTAFATLLRTEPANLDPDTVNEAFRAHNAIQDDLSARTRSAPFVHRDGIATDFGKWSSLAPDTTCPCGSGNSLEKCHAPAVEFWKRFLAGPADPTP